MLIEQHIIWKSMSKLYGVQSLLDLLVDSKLQSCHTLKVSMNIRLIHLRAGLNTLKFWLESPNNQKRNQEDSFRTFDALLDKQLIDNVEELCEKLDVLMNRVKETDQAMLRDVDMQRCLKKYKEAMKQYDHLCDTLINAIKTLETNSNKVITNKVGTHKEHIREIYRMDALDKLSSKQEIEAIDDILQDIAFRKICLSSYFEVAKSSATGKRNAIKSLEIDLGQAKEKLEVISIVEEELKYFRQKLQAVRGYVGEYDRLLRDKELNEIPGSKFIWLLESMRVRTEVLQMSEHFPKTTYLMEQWQDHYGKGDEFKPKAIDLFKTVEVEVKDLFDHRNWIYSVPYKIGIIGNNNVGKSALAIELANVKEFSPMIVTGRSTFGYLSFDTRHYKNPRAQQKVIPITFVDVEGATDNDESRSIGNYIDLIEKADCDLYIIVFDKPFDDHNRTCQNHIKMLKRKYLLVRSNADLLFNKLFREENGEKYKNETSENPSIIRTLRRMTCVTLQTFDDDRLKSKVYFTAVVCDADNLKHAPFAEFDLEKLKKQLVELAITDSRSQRIHDLIIRTVTTVINTCFRRGYVIAKTKYRVAAAVASIVPFADEAFIGRGNEKICQATGIHDHSWLTNVIRGTTNSLEMYLTDKGLIVPQNHLKSGHFKYLKPRATEQTTIASEKSGTHEGKTTQCDNHHKNVGVAGQGVRIIGGVVSAADNIARFIAPSTSVVLRTVSKVGIVASVVVTPLFVFWSFYSTGERMSIELHSICDDLVVVLEYFILNLCNECRRQIDAATTTISDDDPSTSDQN